MARCIVWVSCLKQRHINWDRLPNWMLRVARCDEVNFARVERAQFDRPPMVVVQIVATLHHVFRVQGVNFLVASVDEDEAWNVTVASGVVMDRAAHSGRSLEIVLRELCSMTSLVVHWDLYEHRAACRLVM